MNNPGFYVTNRDGLTGFRLCFSNGYELSVVFGEKVGFFDTTMVKNSEGTDYFSENAEIAVINDKGAIIPFSKTKITRDNVKPEDLLQVISWVANR
jgi:hypothetical protein|tara:strand:- start:359 stop:646 length:288 start_codon:yes stop_codon:yes gene_type:complete